MKYNMLNVSSARQGSLASALALAISASPTAIFAKAYEQSNLIASDA